MSRWQPDARGRMVRAAMDLFTERGFEQTTAGDIAERAGVTERTFFRHFTDKREVLFSGSEAVGRTVAEAIRSAPADLPPVDVALTGVVAVARVLEDDHGHSARRARIVEANPALRERELLKLASLVETATGALRARGVDPLTADLAAHSAVTAFQVGFARWVAEADPPALGTRIAETAAALRALWPAAESAAPGRQPR
ncbi:TetR/AcrR family transcriptional regulator [Actinosynnema sp. NPDC053489]|uniref:TetR/AcrR family transcriptional regulator n=1 Tax=Actinosynnema sp. NPDC053489 TaxID=3363916 RepID=UPI0037CBDF0B